MWIRSAFWTGNIKAGQEVAFRQGINEEMIPGLQRLAGVKGAKALWPHRFEDKAPDHACIILEMSAQLVVTVIVEALGSGVLMVRFMRSTCPLFHG